MKMSELKILFTQGAIKNARVVEDIFGGWSVELDLAKTSWEPLERRRDEDGVCSYKSLNAAYSAIVEVGFSPQGLTLI